MDPAACLVPSREVMLPLPPHSGKGGNQVPGHVRVPGQQGPGGTAKAVAKCETGLGSRAEHNSQLRSGVGSEMYLFVPYMPCKLASLRVNVDVDEETANGRLVLFVLHSTQPSWPQVQRLRTTASHGGLFMDMAWGSPVEWGADCGPVDCGNFPPVSLAVVQPCPSVGRGDDFGANKRAGCCWPL